MSFLSALWTLSLVLSSIALLIMIGLVGARRLVERKQAHTQQLRRTMIPVLLQPGADLSPIKKRLSRSVVADLCIELIRMVRGSDRDAFIDNANRLEVPSLLRMRLHQASPRSRILAAEALAQFKDKRTGIALYRALQDRNPDVRLTAALSLAMLGWIPPLDELITKLDLGNSERSSLVVSLFREIARSKPDQVRDLITSATCDEFIKASAVEALSTSGDYTLAPLINEIAINTPADAPALPRYLQAIGDLHHPAGRYAVLESLAGPDPKVKATAAQAAGQLSLFDAAPMLAELLGDEDWWVRFRAGEALLKLGNTGLTILQDTARNAPETARDAATSILAEKGLAA